MGQRADFLRRFGEAGRQGIQMEEDHLVYRTEEAVREGALPEPERDSRFPDIQKGILRTPQPAVRGGGVRRLSAGLSGSIWNQEEAYGSGG